MNEKVLKCLYDIKIAIDEIDSFARGFTGHITMDMNPRCLGSLALLFR
jgi:hypothetical protein